MLIVPGVSSSSDWNTFQGGAARNGIAGGEIKRPSDRDNWIFETREGLPLAYKPVEYSVPVVSGEDVFIGTVLKRFYCISRKKGEVKWVFNTDEEIESTATVFENYVYFGDSGGTLYALDREKGTLAWRFETSSEILSSPLLYKGIAYFTNTGGEVYALDALTGKRLWQYKRPLSRRLSIRGTSAPSHDGMRVYVGFADGYAVALQPFDGSVIWDKFLSEPRRQFKDIDSSIVPSGEEVYVPSYDGKLFSLKASDGSVNWSYDAGGAGTPVVVGDKIYIPTSKGFVLCIGKDGKLVWERKIEDGIPSSLIYVGGQILTGLSTNGALGVDAASGEERWRISPGSGVYAGLAFADSTLYYLSNGGFVFSIPCN